MVKRFHVLMIKPSRYDDDGYPVQWWRSLMPSNSLACVNGLALDAARRQILGPDVELLLDARDEANTQVDPEAMVRRLRASGDKALVVLVGVQTNQFPRAVDLARPFLKAGFPVCMGGFHVSGCISMLDEMPPEMKAAQDQGIGFFLGEAEDRRLDEVILDAFHGRMKPIYDHLDSLPSIESEPIPFVSEKVARRTISGYSSFDIGRGCPYVCSFCTIINVHGRKSRFRRGADLEKIARENYSHGIRQLFITDDNLARNANWEELFDTLIRLRKEDGIVLRLSIQVDVLCHKIKGFIDKAAAAGVDNVFIGLENINAENLKAVRKNQNRITDYREMLLAWKRHPVFITAGYIIGFPGDTRESLLHDIRIIQRELPIDNLYFTNLTPLPGSEDHARSLKEGVWMDPDLNNYDLHHRVTHHPKMSDQDWDRTFQDLWSAYYSWSHIQTVLRRMYGIRSNKRRTTVNRLAWYRHCSVNLGINPLDGGVIRLRSRRNRRPGFAIEPVWWFYPKYFFIEARNTLQHIYTWLKVRRIRMQIEKDPRRFDYTDAALQPVTSADFTSMDLYTDTRGTREEVVKWVARDARRKGAGVHDINANQELT